MGRPKGSNNKLKDLAIDWWGKDAVESRGRQSLQDFILDRLGKAGMMNQEVFDRMAVNIDTSADHWAFIKLLDVLNKMKPPKQEIDLNHSGKILMVGLSVGPVNRQTEEAEAAKVLPKEVARRWAHDPEPEPEPEHDPQPKSEISGACY